MNDPQALPITTALVASPPQPLAFEPARDIGQAVIRALNEGRSAAELKEAIDVLERLLHIDREQAYSRAFSAFQAECPPLRKDKKRTNVNESKGTAFATFYSSLEEIERVVCPVLFKHGFSRSFTSSAITDGLMWVTCRLDHVQGGTPRTSQYPCPCLDPKSKMMQADQYSSAYTRARRLAFLGVCGLQTAPDTDGVEQTNPIANRPITAAEEGELETSLRAICADEKEFGDRKTKLLGYLKVAGFSAMTKGHLAEALAIIGRVQDRKMEELKNANLS